MGVRQKSINVNCSCGDLIDSYLFLTPVPGLVLKGTGAANSEKNVQFIIERFNLLVSISDRSSPKSTAANYLSYISNLNSNLMAELLDPNVQPKEPHQEPTPMVTGPEVASKEPPSSKPSGTEDVPVAEGSKPLIGKGAGIQFPKALSVIGGAKVLKSMGYGKEVPPPAPFLSLSLSLEVSQEYILLKGLNRAEIHGGEYATKLLCGHNWFPSMLATLPKVRRDIRLLWLENTYGQVGEPSGDGPELRHEFWYPGFVENRRKNQNMERDGATKLINYSRFNSVV